MKIKSFLILLVCFPLCSKTYYDEYGDFMDNDAFIKSYFEKPLKRLKKAIQEVHVISVHLVVDVPGACKYFNETYDPQRNTCEAIEKKPCWIRPKSAQRMEEYILKSAEYPIHFLATGYSEIEDYACTYKGKVKAFGYVWDFTSHAGWIDLERTLGASEKIESLEENPLQAYRQGMITLDKKHATKTLICKARSCHPRAVYTGSI